jgi:hypothetical protein
MSKRHASTGRTALFSVITIAWLISRAVRLARRCTFFLFIRRDDEKNDQQFQIGAPPGTV